MSPKQRAGAGLIAASGVVWALIFALPMTALTTSHKAMAGVGLYVASYLVFFLGLRLLGRELWDAMLARCKAMLKR